MKVLIGFFVAAFALPVFASPPAHDNFADADPIPWPAAGVTSSSSSLLTLEATAEPGEPVHGGVAAQYSVWAKFTADADSAAVITFLSRRPASFGVYEGNSLETLAPVAPINVPLADNYRIYAVSAGTTYFIAANDIATFSGYFGISVKHLNSSQFQNDNFAGATVIPLGGSTSFLRYPQVNSWIYATIEQGEPAATTSETIWWKFTAPSAGWYRASYTSEAFSGAVLESLQLIQPTEYRERTYYYLEQAQTVYFRQTLQAEYSFSSGFSINGSNDFEPYDVYLLNAGIPSGQGSFYANPTGDGVENIIKYLMGLNPAIPVTQEANSHRLPKLVATADGKFEVVYTVNLTAANQIVAEEYAEKLYVTPYYSTDLVTWTRVGDHYMLQDDSIPNKEFRVPLPVTFGPDITPKIFIQLRVTFENYEGSG